MYEMIVIANTVSGLFFLRRLTSINDVAIHVMGDDGNISTARICENGNTTIVFLTEFGDLPLFQIDYADLAHTGNDWSNSYVLNITELQAGMSSVDILYTLPPCG